MKKLLIIPMLFASYMGMAQVADSASIIGKSIRIDNLLVAQNDFPTQMNWDDAVKACASLGPGWRLPTKDELNIIYQNKDKIRGFRDNYYWSSSELGNGIYGAWGQGILGGSQVGIDKDFPDSVRAVRSF